MAFLIEKDEGTSGRRFVPFRLFNSDGTGPVTGASNGTMLGSVNGAAQLSLGSISAVSANAGMYGFTLSQSNVSVLGSIALWTDTIATAFPQHVATVQVVNFNPFSSQSNAAFTLANGLYSAVTVRVDPVNYSGLTIQGVSNISAAKDVVSDITGGVWYAATHSGVTVGAGDIAPNTYSGVSVRIQAGNYGSINTFGVNNIAAGNYSGASVEVKSGGIQTSSIGAGTYSGVTMGINNIAAGAYSGVTVDGAKFLSTAGERSIASSHFSTNFGNNRFAQDAVFAIRNRVFISGSTGTVYQTDDTTSQFTFSVTTVAAVGISDYNPAG